MRNPLMFRAVADAREAMLRELLAGSKADYLAACERYDALLAKHEAFVSTIAERATPKPAPIVTPQPVRPRDEADDAIDRATLFNRDPRLRRHLEQFVRSRRAEGVASGEIAQAILHPPASDAGEYEAPE